MRMQPALSKMPSHELQAGFSAITALVLIVLLGLLGAYMATITGVQSLNTTLSNRTEQAWSAANSGAEWGIRQVLVNGNCSGFPNTLTITGGSGNSFSVTVSCNLSTVTEASETYNVYQLSSAASSGAPGDIGFVSRSVRVNVTDAS